MRLRTNLVRMASIVAGLALTQAALAQVSIKGWGGGGSAGPNNYEFGIEQIGGTKSAFIASKGNTPAGFGTLTQGILADNYRGKRLRLSARVKTANAASAQLWMRVDGDGGANPKVLAFDNMNSRPVTGTTDWKRYEIVLDVPPDSVAIVFGVFLNGKGKLWADDFQLESVGKDVRVTGGPIPPRTAPKAPVNLGFDQ